MLKTEYIHHSKQLHSDLKVESQNNYSSLVNKKISFVTATDERTGSTRIRVYGIANELKRRGYDVSINENLNEADILVFQKSNPKFLLKTLLCYASSDKFFVFDIDDLFFDDHINLIKCCDLIITSCGFMRAQYLPYNEHISVLDGTPDVIDEDIPLASYNLKNPKICAFGTEYNMSLIEKFDIKNVTKITKGGDIEWTRETVDYDLQKFDLVVVPQEKTPEGLSKDNCRMLKLLYLGIPSLYTDLPEYVKLAKFVGYPDDFFVKDGEDWNKKIEKIKSGEIKFDFDFKYCRKLLCKNYSISAMTDKWIKIVENSYNKKDIINKKGIYIYKCIFFYYIKKIMSKLF